MCFTKKSIICVVQKKVCCYIIYGVFTDLNENNSEEAKEILINIYAFRDALPYLLGFDRWQTTMDDQCSVSEPSDPPEWIIIKPSRSRTSPFSGRDEIDDQIFDYYEHTHTKKEAEIPICNAREMVV